ncbi:hypothetical protein [Rhizobium mongolense]|uniref:hypothetical protein n=1 Tax=Rhizobium mongolense TaxID=57676 RepID=UPI0034A26FD5
MEKAVVFGIAGQADLWIADLDAGTVKSLGSPVGELAQVVGDVRKTGGTFVKKVDFAIAVSSAQTVFSGHVDG